jgi:ABC-type lipoprotein release transport system permease subunit
VYTYSIAARYMLKRPISYVAILLVAFVVMMYLMVISVLEGFKDNFMDKIQNIEAHVTIDIGKYAGGIAHPEQWADEIAHMEPGIKGVTLGIETPAMAIFPKDRTIGTLRGIDLDRELKIGRLNEILDPKDLTEFGVQEFNKRKYNGCIVGGAWKSQFHLKKNDRVTFIFSDDSDKANTKTYNVIGFYEGKNPYLENGAFIDRKVLADELSVSGRAKTLYVWLNEPNRPDLAAVKDRLKKKMEQIVLRDEEKLVVELLAALKAGDPKLVERIVPVFNPDKAVAIAAIGPLNGRDAAVTDKALDVLRAKDEHLAERLIEGLNRENRASKVNVETWQEKDGNFYDMVTRENLMMRSIMGVFLALIAFILFLIFGRLVAEKVRDIGALRALGASPGGIMKCFLIQGFFIGAIGVVLGLAMAEVFLRNMNEIAWFRNIYPKDSDLIPYVTLSIDRYLIVGLTLFSALAGAFFPAWRASRLNPVECLRHE